MNRAPQKPKKKSDPLPDHLVLTPERSAKIAERQAQLRAESMQRGRLGPEARRMQVAIAHETSARAEYEMLRRESRRGKPEDRAAKHERLLTARSRLAEALGMQGRYNEAASVEREPQRRKHYRKMWQAVWRDDEESCACAPFVDGDMALTHDHVAEEVISLKHDGKLMPAIRCNECEFMNVRPLTPELHTLERARARAAALIHGRDAKALKHDARAILAELADRKVLTQ
jgi:hypothetical protein